MGANTTLSQIRRKRLSGKALLWFAQALIAFLRVIFRGIEVVSPPLKRQRLRELREKMEAINHGKDQVLTQIQTGSVFDGIETMNLLLMKHASPEDREQYQTDMAESRAKKLESEALQAIRRQAGDATDLAVEGFRKYLDSYPDSALAFSYLGTALKQMGEFKGSEEAYRETIRLAGDNTIAGGNAHIAIGEVLQSKGDFSGAISEFKHVIDNASESSQIIVSIAFLHLGNTLHETGKRDEARAAWKEAIKWDTTGVIAKKVREQLKAKH